MPLFGALFLIAQIACAVHVMRTGRNTYWIYLVVFLPVIGMAAYFLAEILPEMIGSRSGRLAAAGLVQTIDPGRGVRRALREVQVAPTTHNKIALAESYLASGQIDAAIALYREVLTGIHATDPAIMLGLARALFAAGDMAETQAVLERLREANPDYASPEGHLLYARSLELQDKLAPALAEYAALAPYYPGQEARCRYALLLARTGRPAEARQIFQEICHSIDLGPRHQYREQREWYGIAKRELAALGG